MCSVGDDIEEQENNKFMQERPKLHLAKNVCMKCELKPNVVLHNKYPYCKSCFIKSTVHKFKALLGKSRLVHPNDNVLIYHRIGHPGTALLNFLRSGLDLTTPKKIRFKPIVLFIEDQYNLSAAQRRYILENVNKEIQYFNFPCYFISFVQYVLHPEDLQSHTHQNYEEIIINEEDALNIKSVVKKKCNLTVQQEVFKVFEQDLLIKTAKLLKCKFIFTSDLGIDIASQLLTSISLGRGSNAAFDIGTVDLRNDEVTIIRPLRNFSIKELALYNVFNNLNPVSFLKASQNPYSSVQNLMEKFVSDLQINYPSTISTIVRTGDKLSIDKNFEQNEKCPLCKVPLENTHDKLGSAEATNFSHWASTQLPDANLSLEEQSTQLLENFKNTCELKYCFACSQIVDFL
ncbi:hypothetical protein ILUMI_01073 [Ignelater luminosus]|uniref:Cytoplasmic tRNA 2-thiolation protein 2 n=1 Tax=Ignelater luminosus TaxID=2038154 RepID=A0A8K0DJ62_IGNLU|nr:hypothetical protein ILUMI_01073 [Ignelater luminosus]